MRRFWLLETNHRFLRRALRIPALATSFRNRLSISSCDSPDLKLTDKPNTSYPRHIAVVTQPLLGNTKTRLVFPVQHRRPGQPSPQHTQSSDEAQYHSIPSEHLPLRLHSTWTPGASLSYLHDAHPRLLHPTTYCHLPLSRRRQIMPPYTPYCCVAPLSTVELTVELQAASAGRLAASNPRVGSCSALPATPW